MVYRNLVEMLAFQADRLGPKPALRYKADGLHHDLSWNDYWEMTQACAVALVEAGVKADDRVGLLSENRVEWLIADMGLLAAGAVCVPPHAPLTASQVQFELADAGVSWLFVSTESQLDKIRAIRRQFPALRGVVVFDDNISGDDFVAWKQFLQQGRSLLQRNWKGVPPLESRGPEDLATIMYTSGTTGRPKGVMLTHGNLVSNSLVGMGLGDQIQDAVRLGWLPLSHIYARTVDHYGSLAGGATLALAVSADTVVENLIEVAPTHFAAVPRFYEKVLQAVASSDPVETRRKLKQIFGPRIDWISSGGAPLPLPIAQAFHDAGVLLLPGYGLTESSPIISFNTKSHFKLGTVGRPIPGVEVRIAADGEILTRGPHVMKGYWKNAQSTAETIDADGWLHTGDLGRLDEDDYLSITGRKKEILVLSNGKKVVPSHLEGLLLSDDLIDQALVSGEGKNYLTALLVPHWDKVALALQDEKEPPLAEDKKTLANDPRVIALVRRHVDHALRDLANWQQIKRFAILTEPFSVANDQLTVSLKLRRNVVQKCYEEVIQSLYLD